MKKLIITLFICILSVSSFAEERLGFFLLDKLLNKSSTTNESNKNSEEPREKLSEEAMLKNDNELSDDELKIKYYDSLVFRYTPKETAKTPVDISETKITEEKVIDIVEAENPQLPKEKIFTIKLIKQEKNDYRPQEVATIESVIDQEKIREKAVVMLKLYDKVFEEHLESISSDSEAIYNLGNQYFLNKQYEKSRDIFRRNTDTIENLFGAATTNRFLGDFQNAINYYSEIIDRDPDFSEPFLGRGICYRNLNKYREALSDFLIYKSMNNSEESYLALGNIYLLMDEYENAKIILNEARILFPNSKLVSNLLNKAYSK